MNLLLDYGSSSDGEEPKLKKKINQENSFLSSALIPVNLNPSCDITTLVDQQEFLR
jgi:hypothetical protein